MVQGIRISSDRPNEKKVRIVDFGDTLTEILRNARKEQLKNRMQYGELYHKNYYRKVKDKNRVYYEFYHLDGTENVPEDYKEISFVCLRPDGSLELPSTLGIVCRKIAQKLDGFEGFHFLEIPTQELIILLSGFLISEPSGRLSCDTSSGSIISFPPVFFSFTPL